MAKSGAVCEGWKSEDLEIASIGAIYTGPWDKKYWSSSRGKDRYPYPVGYQAVRAHNGNTYKMEIQEGPKGPVFLIRYSTESCFGQTPDIALEKFQKISFSHPKILNGKRFTCKMDGVEFFGFKNPLVQRLLRELVANTYGATETQFVIPSSNNGASKLLDNDECLVACANPSLSAYLDRSVPRKKRSSRSEVACQNNSVDGNDLKRPRHRDLLSDGEITNSEPMPSCSAKGGTDILGLQGTEVTPERLHLNCVPKEDSYISIENPPVQEQDQLTESCESKPVSTFYTELHGLHGIKDEMSVSKEATEARADDESVPKENQNMTDANLCAPDTLDSLQEDTSSSAFNVEDVSTCQVKDELTMKDMLVSEGFVVGPHVEELAESGLNMTLKSSDSDSADQDIAQSMITLLLPQAIPLLKKASKRRQMKNNISGASTSRLSLAECSKESHIDDVPVSGILKPQAVSLSTKACNVDDVNPLIVAPDSDTDSRFPDFTSYKSIIPDSLDESHPDIAGSDHIMSSPEEPYPADLGRLPCTVEHVAKSNVNVLVSDLDTSRSKDFSSFHVVHTVLDANTAEEYMKKSVLVPHSTSPTKRISSQENQEPCAEAGGKSLQQENHSENKDSKSKLDFDEGKYAEVNAISAEVDSVKQEKYKVYTRKRVSTRQLQRERNLSSESDTVSRNVVSNSVSTLSPMKIPPILGLQPLMSANCGPERTDLLRGGIGHEEQQSQSFEMANMNEKCPDLSNDRAASVASQGRRSVCGIGNASKSMSSFPSPKLEDMPVMGLPSGSDVKLHTDVKINNELAKNVELLGCYSHPMPISSVLHKSVANEIYVCVVSYPTTDGLRNLFVYKISDKEPAKGCPSIICHTPVILPFLDGKSGRNEALERSGLHFTPDGQGLILCGDIKTPYCREGKIECLCITCTSAGFEKNTVRIVQVKLDHVSLVSKLRAVENVQCLVVCGPKYLVAVGKTGQLIVWVMDSSWRVPVEEFIVPINPCISSCIVELKQIPKCPYLVVGHNGDGEFTVWDISKRILVSRFSSPNNSTCEFIPISLFAWHPMFSPSTMEDHVDGILAATRLWFSKHEDNDTLVPTEGKDMAVWLLVSTASEPDDPCYRPPANSRDVPARCWRLALLTKNAVIYGQQLDPRASAAGAMSGRGILGTHEGLVYLWDLSTGANLGSLHGSKGHRVSCISTDDSTPGILCISSDDGQLLLYRHR